MLDHWVQYVKDVHRGFKNAVNLSKSFRLSAAQFALLSRGLNFIPSQGNRKNLSEQTRFDIEQHHRRLKLAVYFQKKPDSQCPPFTPKSEWVPPNGKLPPEITALIDADLKHFQDKLYFCRVKSNLTNYESEALTSLRKHNKTTIKHADKGSAVVIWDRDQYLWEGYKQCNDKMTFKEAHFLKIVYHLLITLFNLCMIKNA